MAVADGYAKNESYEPALRLIERALELDPGNPDTTKRFAQLERLQGALAKRELIVHRLARRDPKQRPAMRLTSSQVLEFWPSLAASAMVHELSADRLARLFEVADLEQWGDHMTVIRRGQAIARGYWILEGAVEAVMPQADGPPLPLRPIQPGEFFGEGTLLDDRPCPVSYRAVGQKTTLLRLNKRSLESLLENDSRALELIATIRRHGWDGLLSSTERH
jgi:hypothetical protein